MTTKEESARNWFVGVSFKQELLSEYLIQQGYRYTGSLGLPVSLQFRKYVDNDICGVREDYDLYALEIRKDYRKHLPRIFEAIKEAADEFVAFSKTLAKEELHHYSNKELIKNFQRFCKLYERAAGPALPLGFLGEMVMMPVLQEKITPLLLEKRVSFADFTRIISLPSQVTIIAKERADLLALAAKIQRHEKCKQFLEQHSAEESVAFLQDDEKGIRQSIEKHAAQYIWVLKTLLQGEDYTPEKVLERVQALLRENPEKQLGEIAASADKQTKELDILYRQLPADAQEDVKLFQEVVYFRDARLMWLNEGGHYSALLLQEIAKRLNLAYEEVIYLLPLEIERGLNDRLPVSKAEIQSRLERYALVLENQQITLYTGEEVEQHRVKSDVQNTTEVKGNPAFQGKATGKVKLVKDRTELYKVEKGDILVTRLTTPDFVIAMEKAAAIITDLGGITSHAAIVSRELRIPCLVGTQYATKVLKDGDLVEVDAYTGVVRKL